MIYKRVVNYFNRLGSHFADSNTIDTFTKKVDKLRFNKSIGKKWFADSIG